MFDLRDFSIDPASDSHDTVSVSDITPSVSEIIAQLKSKHRTPNIVHKTETPEKTAQIRAISKGLELPVNYRNFRELVVGTASEEDTGDCRKNGEKKHAESRPDFEPFGREGRARNGLIAKCKSWRTDYRDTYFVNEDAGIIVDDLRVWLNVRRKLEPFVPEEIIKLAEANKFKKGPGSELGPIMGAVGGPVRLMNIIREAALDVTDANGNGVYEGKALPIKDYVVIFRSKIGSKPTHTPQYVEATTTAYLPITRTPFKETAGREAKTWDFLCTSPEEVKHYINNPGQSVRTDEEFDDLLINRSTRSKALRKLVAAIAKEPYEAAVTPSVFRDAQANLTKRKKKGKERRFKIVLPTSGYNGGILGSLNSRLARLMDGAFELSRSSPQSATSVYDLLNLEKSFKKTDALVFQTFDATNEKLRIENYYKLVSAIVEKQTNPRHFNMSIIVQDDGCYAPLLKTLTELSNNGMFNNFMRTPAMEGTQSPIVTQEDITHKATHYYDVVAGRTGSAALNTATAQVLAHRARDYSPPLEHHFATEPAQGAAPPKNAYAELILTSATSDNKPLNDSVKNHAASPHIDAIIWGAGNRHAMGSALKGALRAVEDFTRTALHLVGFSTPSILKAETQNGYLPVECTHGQVCENIYLRMTKLFSNTHAAVLFQGGAGTVQEGLAKLLINSHFGEEKQKPLAVLNSDIHGEGKPFWNSFIHAVFPTKLEAKLAEHNVHVMHSENELHRDTQRRREAWETARLSPKSRSNWTPVSDYGSTLTAN